MEGILYAIVPMITWGSIGFVSNKIGGTPNQQTFGMTFGALFFAIGLFFIVQPPMTLTLWGVGIIGGILWSIGQNGQFNAMKFLGVSIANPLSSGSQLVLGSLIGAIVFKEWKNSSQFTLGIIAIILLIIGFYFSSKNEKNNIAEQKMLNYSKGFKALIYSTIGYISYTVLFNNIMHFQAFSVLLPMSIGMCFASMIFMKFKITFEGVVLKNSLVGLMWGVGNIFMLLAASKAGLAIAFSFSQLGVVISIVGGILFLGESKTQKEIKWIVTGIILFLLGAILLGIVKSS
ncbi:MAG: GRP family sugar transporter [Streptococcus sp.]|nr:GRP family sugar transporter [Streptococcus sp.]